MDERIIAALIGAIVVATGWLISYRLERERYRDERRDKEMDVQKALRAEIKALVEAPQNSDLEGSLERGMARFDAETEDDPYLPFIPHEKHDTVYQALLSEIHLLPTETVEPVILYYNQAVSIALMATDLRSDRFAELDSSRRKKMLHDYMRMKIEGKKLGQDAITALTRTIGDAYSPSRTDPVRSGPEEA
ncbi:hypothetical protein [Halovulum sp. GXIMD14793]